MENIGHAVWGLRPSERVPPLVILNNGVEFAVTYAIMRLALFFTGAGRYVSVDYWVRQRIQAVPVGV